MRKQLAQVINEQMVYKRSSYDSDKNAFTRVVDDAVKEMVDKFKKDYSRTVDEMFTQECLTFAQEKLRERLGIKKT